MLAELNPEPTNTILDPSSFLIENPSYSSSILTSNSRVFNDDSEYDLIAIPGIAAYPPQNTTNNNLDFPLKLYEPPIRFRSRTSIAIWPQLTPFSAASSPTRLQIHSDVIWLRALHYPVEEEGVRAVGGGLVGVVIDRGIDRS
ncbi:uncharacterized protein HKW66_Vig0034300 [Vigna angularis]|uniref:Uncharacterized protein n=1 Tax=Phaseolus angularis TaxID=3914 RepID=A0A8T0LCW6_PHAAN|nr:uncharacterized protein HKW66_Vig0034300 [Vigna angularis]